MARQKAYPIENNFIGGLNTEATALNFPTNACTEEKNCVFVETGRVKRRSEIDLEANYVENGNYTIYSSNEAFSEYLWTDAGGSGTTTFLVQQQGLNIHLFDVSANNTPSAHRLTSAPSLNDYRVSGTTLNPAEYRCQYAQGNGYLIVTNPACNPLIIQYDQDTNDLTAQQVTLKYRDFVGLTDNYDLTERPSFGGVVAMKADADGALHYYNLLNQGWWQGPVSGGTHNPTLSALGLWDAARTDMPSNADTVAALRSSFTVPLDTTKVETYTQGNTPSPKGHFILNVGGADRYTAMTDEGFTLTGNADVDSYITPVTAIGSLTNNAYASDGATGTNYATITDGPDSGSSVTVIADGFTGLSLGGATRIFSAVIRGNVTYSYGKTPVPPSNVVVSVRLWASNSAPANATDGTALSGILVVPENIDNGYAIASNDTVTTYQYVWVQVIATLFSSGVGVVNAYITWNVSEAYFYKVENVTAAGSLPTDDVTKLRPRCVEFFAGRAWYAGIDSIGLANTIYFSRVVEKIEHFGQCYQDNDPTSEEFYNILATDGGVIKIPEMGKVVRLFNYQNVLLIFATNGVWIVRGSTDRGGFSATDFTVRRISSLGTQSPLSFVDVNGFPMWWGEDGIFMIEYNPQFDSFSVQNISEEKIKTFYLGIPAYNRKFAKGAYDSRNEVVYWLYDDNATQSEVQQSLFYNVLCYNTRSKAFYTWDIGASTALVRGIMYVEDSVGITDPEVKFTTTYEVTPGVNQKLTYSELRGETYQDWYHYGTYVTADTDDIVDYTSYFITGYRMDGDKIRFLQSNYVMVFIEKESNAGVYMQGVFDFAYDPGSGQWSTRQDSYQQETYDAAQPYHSIITRRLKVRGKGRALQLKFTSQAGKPFTIIGWSIFETQNADV